MNKFMSGLKETSNYSIYIKLKNKFSSCPRGNKEKKENRV